MLKSSKLACKVERPGGTNYLLPASVPKEIIVGIFVLRYCCCKPRLDGRKMTRQSNIPITARLWSPYRGIEGKIRNERFLRCTGKKPGHTQKI